MRYKISEKAIEDIENIWCYTMKNWSVQQADRYYQLIFDEIEHIAKYPLSGKNCSSIRKDYCCSKVKSHLIFYKYKKDENLIEIIRVLHQNMNIDERLND